MQNVPFAAQQEQVNKFLQASKVLGAQMDQMQGTTRIIYDTVNFNGIRSYDFFSEVASKQNTQPGGSGLISGQAATNITDNKFEPGEGMVIKELYLANLAATADPATALNLNDTVFGLGLINIYVGNNRVIKDLPLMSLQPTRSFNNFNATTTSATNSFNRRQVGVRLSTNIVIPPQIQFYATVRLPFAPSAAVNNDLSGLRVYFKGYGKLFNPRNNY